MPTFTYIGYDKNGYRKAGAKNFQSQEEMQSFLSKEGITEADIFKSETEYKTKLFALAEPSELSLFCKQMSVLFYSHMTLMEGIELLAGQTGNKQFKIALNEIYAIMDNGKTLAEAMSMYDNIFPAYMLNMVTIGETSGTLDSVFQRLSLYYDKEGKTRKKIRKSVAYPVVLSGLMSIIVILLIVKVLPIFNNILSDMGEEITGLTRGILNTGLFFSRYAIYIIILIAIGIVGFRYYISTPHGSLWFDRYLLRSRFTKYINMRFAASKVARSMSVLLKSGVQILNAMEIIVPLLENKYLEQKFLAALEDLKEGKDLKETFEQIEIFPPLFIRMLVIGQSTGQLDEMLEKCASVFDDETDDAIERLTSMIEPILIIILSVIVGFILLSIMLPMIDIMTLIG